MPKTYEYETKVGMLKYKVEVSETTIDDDGISLLVTYESYETGIAYETTYDHEDIGKIHKLFILEPTLILDMIGDNKLITKVDVTSKDVLIFYNMSFMRLNYEIVLKADRVTHEGVDSATGDLQRQNKVLLRQVSKLTNRLDYMEKQLQKLAKIVAYGECGVPIAHRNEKTFDMLCELTDVSDIYLSKTDEKNRRSYAYTKLSDVSTTKFKDNIIVHTLLKHGSDVNQCDVDGKSVLMYYIGRIHGTSIAAYGKEISIHVKEYIKAGADVNIRDNTGKTVLMYCDDRMKHCYVNSNPQGQVMSSYSKHLQLWLEIKSILLHAGAK